MTHKEELFVLACGLAKATNARDSDLALAAAFALAHTVTEEDQKEAGEMVKNHIDNCNCTICTAAKEVRAGKQSGESFAV